MKLIRWLDDSFEETLLVIFLALITVVEMVQVIIRNVPWIPALTWAEEFCRFMWIGSVFISLPFTIRRSSMLRVNVLMDMLPQFARKIVNMFVDVVTIASMSLLAYHSVSVIQKIRVSAETSPAMRWPMWIVYICVIVGFTLGAIRGVQMLIIHIRDFNKREKSTIEKTMEEAAEEAEAGRKAEMEGGEA